MATTTIAQPTRTSTRVDRIAEGRELFRTLGHSFEHRHGAWIVPSRMVESRTYAVRLGPVETCECADYQHRGARCAHIVAAAIAQSKSRICSCCGQRVLGRFLSEVTENDGLLSWFVGDQLCADCACDRYWG